MDSALDLGDGVAEEEDPADAGDAGDADDPSGDDPANADGDGGGLQNYPLGKIFPDVRRSCILGGPTFFK